MKLRALLGGVGTVAVILAGAAAARAQTQTLSFDFGSLGVSGYNGGNPCSTNCIIPGNGTHTFSLSGVSVNADAHSSYTLSGNTLSLGTAAYLTQKPGPLGVETGLGESDSSSTPSDSQYEIAASKSVTLNNSNALNNKYRIESIGIGSIQAGETADIFGGTSLTTQTLIAQVVGTTNTSSDFQTVNLSNQDKFVTVLGLPNSATPGGSSNVVLVDEVLPEPSSLAPLAVGLLGLVALRRRRRGAPAARA